MTTKNRIIKTAMKLFAKHGYHGVTVREICRCCSVNVAMVNYHFSSKEGLYHACLQEIFGGSGGSFLSDLDRSVKDAESWKEAVKTWIMHFSSALHALRDGGTIVAGIYKHEIVRPSPICSAVRDSFAEPVLQSLISLLRMAEKDEQEVLRWAAAIWSQLSAHAVVDPFWREPFRSPDKNESDWGREFAEFVCRQVFARLEYRP